MVGVKTRAAVQRAARDVEIRELPVPDEVDDGAALLRVEGCGVCGADYERYVGEFDDQEMFEYPVVIGHEPVGRIAEIGADASDRWGVEAGDRVAVEPFAPCGVCEFCVDGRYTICRQRFIYGVASTDVGAGIWGGFAEYMLLRPGTIVHRLSDRVSIEDATLFNPLGAGFEWVCRAGGVEVGDAVLVLGPGQRGLSSVIAANEAGADPIVVTGLTADADRLDLAEDLGATHTIDVEATDLQERVAAICGGVDVAVDTSPGATRPVVDAIEATRPGGTIVLAGTKGGAAVEGFVSDDVVLDNLTVQGTIGTRSWSFERAIDVIEAGDYPLERMHTHRLPLSEIDRVLRLQGGELDGEDAFHVTVVPEGS